MAISQEVKDQLKILKNEIAELRLEIQGAEEGIKRLGGSIGETSNLIADAAKRMKSIGNETKNFALSIKEQYQYAEKLAGAYKQTSIDVGISASKQASFGKVFIKSLAIAEKYGGTIEDVKTAFSSFAAESGRARFIQPEEIDRIISLEKATGLVGDSAAKLMENMEQMGKSSESSANAIQEMFVDSQKLGLNASKVTKVLSDNFNSMQSYSFRGGVKGMTEMAKLAVKMRMDVSDMLGMADKFYEPEQAIEAVANLQMLGGDVADAFGDPFEVMYLARNKPEELAKRVQTMTENMMQFNSETGEYEFPPEARMQLKAAGEQLGINTDSMIEISRQATKIKDIKMNVSGNINDPEMREGIAGMARMNKDKQWVIDLEGKGEIPIGDLNMDDAEKLLSTPTTTDGAIMATAKLALTSNEYLDQIAKSNKTRFVGEADVYQAAEDALRAPLQEFTESQRKITDAAIEAFNETGAQKNIEKMFDNIGSTSETFVGEVMSSVKSNMEAALGDIKEIEIKDAKVYFNNLIKNDKGDVTGGGKPDTTGGKTLPIGEDMASMGGGNRILSGGFGDFSLDNRDLVIAGKPQNLLGGSGGGDTIKVEPITMTINGDLTLNAPNGSTNIDLDMESIKGVVTKMITDSLNGANYSGGKVGSSLNTA
tara:strand:- start:2782 stop:4746 length:1965 start_codon:yes stop_codon:yes gene_type:complete